MIGYNDLYELLRKEKYSETLQPLPKNFIEEFVEYISQKKEPISDSGDLFADSVSKSKKQLENAISLFKELMLRRKKKILNLVFIATETGIMKRDYENMLLFERETFDKVVRAFENSDKELLKILNGEFKQEESRLKMIVFEENVEQFVDHNGSLVGPFKAGEIVNIDVDIANILVSGGKASFIDQD